VGPDIRRGDAATAIRDRERERFAKKLEASSLDTPAVKALAARTDKAT